MNGYFYVHEESRQMVYIPKDAEIKEDSTGIHITEKDGKKHTFPTGTIVFSDIQDANSWDIK